LAPDLCRGRRSSFSGSGKPVSLLKERNSGLARIPLSSHGSLAML
jgi:hypothetical protein